MRLFTNREKSKRSEAAAATNFGGRVQIASGALRIAKGDIRTDRFLIEDKVTDKKSFSLSVRLWEKIRLEASNARRTPMMRITVQGRVLCVVAETTMMELT